MPFFLFQLIFAVLAVGLLVTVFFIVRQVLQKRQDATPPPRATRPIERAPAKRGPGRRTKPAEAAPEPAAPHVRRRQLSSFAEAERGGPQEPELPEPETAEPEMAEPEQPAVEDAPPPPGHQPQPPAVGPIPDDDLPALEDAPPPPIDGPPTDEPPRGRPGGGYHQAVLERLEAAFEALQGGQITLADYAAQIRAEAAAVDAHLVAARGTGDDEGAEQAAAAREAVQWCLDWAAQQGAPDAV